ncbi:DivIVA domain-containing protein [Microcella humidisoli]|uniref:Cell wall synthesis protein Wag31 n=1 Tax=Microcella humidisoli TaxID=2963406 RepID=A0ABY5FV81_9MICO|nr:DivIVA domain-containing protein [Microcella humidisoli]UTT62214.1 DivIVA domain-containing protein [Microcella humidisoli]
MALTPEDVVNKRFQSTKFREGYDQDEVDDFLDEIVVELRRLNQENDELRQRLVAADARIAELGRGGSVAAAPMEAPAPAIVAAPPAPVPAPVVEAPVASASEPSADTNNLLQLARRLHEEHVREGVAKKEQLIAEGQAEAARIVAEVTNAQQGQLQALEQERSMLQQRVDELRTFEREYRQQLRTYIQTQLAELEGTAQPAAAPSASTAGSAPAAASTVGSAPVYGSAPAFGSDQPFPGSAPSYPAPASPATGYPAPQSPPPGQFPGYGS